jgi:hypothetical protein
MLKKSILIAGLSIFIVGCGSVAEDRSILKESEDLEKPSDNLAPANVADIEFSDIKIDEVTLSWSVAKDSDGFINEYYVSYRTDNRDWSSEIRTEDLTLTIKNLASFSNYEFRVRAVDNEGTPSEFTYASMSTDLSHNNVTPEREDVIIAPKLYQRSNTNYIHINQTSKENSINIDDSECWKNVELDELLECTDIIENRDIDSFSQSREFSINFNQYLNTIQENRLQVVIDEISNITGVDEYIIVQD